MANTKIKVLLGVFLVIFLFGTVAAIISHQTRAGDSQQALKSLANAHHKKQNDAERKLFKATFMSVHQEVIACDRLHLPAEEKQKRVNAVDAAAQAEAIKVRASHYELPYHPPPTD